MQQTVPFLAAALLVALAASPSTRTATKPVRVFILAGQSNMQGHGKVSTFEHIGMDPATKPMIEKRRQAFTTGSWSGM